MGRDRLSTLTVLRRLGLKLAIFGAASNGLAVPTPDSCLGDGVVGVAGQARVVDLGDAGVGLEARRDLHGAPVVLLHPQSERLHAAEHQVGGVGVCKHAQVHPGCQRDAMEAAWHPDAGAVLTNDPAEHVVECTDRPHDVRLARDGPREHVVVAREVLGRRVQHQVRTQGKRLRGRWFPMHVRQ